MLNSLRNSVGSLGAKILLGLLILAFAAWGVADVFTGRTQTVVATVGEAEIEAIDYARELENRIQSLRQTTGVNLSIDDARRNGFDRVVLAQLTTRTALDEEAKSLGLDASDEIVATTIRTAPAFQNAYGRFDKDLYERRLSYSGLSPAEYEKNVRRDLAREALLQAVGVGTSAPRPLAEALHAYRNEKRSFEHIALSPEDVDEPDAPSDAELKTFHEENAPRFTAPEYRKVAVLVLSAEELGKGMEISDEAVRAAYDERIEQYTTPQRRSVEQVVFDSEEEAKEAAEKIASGLSFAKIAEARGLSASDVSLGTVSEGELPGALSDAAFAPEKPGVTEPVGTALGWAILNIRSIEPEKVVPLEEVSEALRKGLALEQARTLVPERAVDADDLIAGGASLSEAAGQSGARFIDVEAIDASGRDPDGNRVEGAPADPEFLNRVFASEIGAQPTLVEGDSGDYFAVRVDGVTEAALRPLDTIKDEVKTAWMQTKRAEALATLAGELKSRLEGDDSLDDIAEDFEKTVRSIGPITRTDRSTALSADMLKALFEADEGDVIEGAASVGDDRLLGILSEIEPATSGDDAEAIDRATETYAGDMSQDLVQMFSQSALDRHPTLLRPQAIERTLSEIGQRY